MKKKLLFFTLLITTFGFGQIDSQSDKEAIKELYKKLGRYQEGYFDRPLSLIYGITTKEFEGINRVIKINLPSGIIMNQFNNAPLSEKIDLSVNLKKLEKLEFVDLSPEPKVNDTESYLYFVNFENLQNLKELQTFKFKIHVPKNNIKLLTQKVNSLNTLINFKQLDLDNLQLDNNENPFIYEEIATLKNVENLSIIPYNRKGIKNIYFENSENLKGLTFQSFEGNLPFDLFSNLPNLKSFSAIDGNFTFIPPININILEELKLGSLNLNITSNNFQNFSSLKSLIIWTNQIELPTNFSDLKNLKSFEITQNTIEGLEPITRVNSLNKLAITFNYANQKSLDLQNLNNLKTLEYKYYHNYDEDPNNYLIPNNLNKLSELESLDISVSKIPVELNSLNKLKSLNVLYVNNELFPKIDFSNNITLEHLVFENLEGYLTTPRIKFDKDFEKLTNLSFISFRDVPVEMDVTNKFNKLFNATHSDPNIMKYISFRNLHLDIPNKLDGILNICNNQDIYLDIQGSSPKVIDYRNKSLTNSAYFKLNLKDTDNPLIIVDDINKFKKTFGETYRNSTTNTNVAYNLTTSTEPCERTLSTNNLTKSDVRIYPNPVVDILNIESDVNKNSVKLFDITGKIIESYTINDKKLSIIVNHLSKGIYIVEIENEKGKTISKFIKK